MPAPAGYTIETIDDLPDEAELEAGGLRTRADGSVVVSTRHGEIWEFDPDGGEWTKVTNALSNALGVWIDDDTGDIYSGTMPALVQVSDDDGDGLGDDYTVIADDWGWSGNYHEFVFGPVRDSEGNFYLNLNLSWAAENGVKGSGGSHAAPWRGWMVQITPDGEFVPFASGLRSPSGIGINDDDELFYTDNQGDYVPACHLSHVEEGNFYGHPASLVDLDEWTNEELNDTSNEVFDEMRTPPAAWVPYSQSRATAGLTFDEGGNFGPFEGQIFAGGQGNAKVMRFALEEVSGQYQGAVFNFADGLQSGVVREEFSPDGQSLWLGQTARGWGGPGSEPYGLQRIDYDGETTPFEIHSISVLPSGFEIEFTKPVDGAFAAVASNYDVSHWTYDNNQGYGSNRIDETAVDAAEMTATLSEDKTSVTLELPSIYITPQDETGVVGGTRLYGITVNNVQSADGESLEHSNAWYTVNRLPEGAVSLTYETTTSGDGLVEVTGTVSNPTGTELTGGSLSLTTDDSALSVTSTSDPSFDTVAPGDQYSAEWVVSVPDSEGDHELTLSTSFTQGGEQYDQSTSVTITEFEGLSIPYGMDCGGAHTDETVTIDGLEFDPTPAESQAIDITGNRTLTPDEIWWPDQVDPSPNPNSYGPVGQIPEVANTEHDTLYKTEHWANGELGYTFTVENGAYDVTLHFSELVSEQTPTRVFSVDIQGETVIDELDLVEEAGGPDTALVYTFENVEVTDNELVIEATSSSENPKFSGIEIREGDAEVEPELLSAPYGMDCGGSFTDETVTIDGLTFDPSPAESQAIDITGSRTLEPDEFWWPDSIDVTPAPNAYGGGLGTDIANTDLDSLYQTEHWAEGELTYDVSIENGVYDVTLHLAEIAQTAEDERVFSATVNGEPVFENYDLFADVGANAAVTKTIEGVVVTDNQLTIDTAASVNNPKVSGIEIREGQADIELEAGDDGWIGVAPSDIADETNPTLTLTAGEEYSLQWTNGGGGLTNFEIVDGEGTELVSSDYSDEAGETQTLVFTATTAMDAYRASTDAALQGDIDVTLPGPETVTPGGVGVGASPPSNGTALWNGEDATLDDWQSVGGGPAEWTDEGDYFEVNYGTGDIVTDESFGDCHLHLEWRAPTDVAGSGQSRANSGVFLMDRYEFQVLDTYDNPTYADGQAGAYYAQAPPLANPLRPPGEWQAYDIIWRGPRFADDGSVVRPAQATVLINGVVVQAHLDIGGPNTAGGIADYSPHPPAQPLRLQDHNDLSPPEFRNIWYQPLPEDLDTGQFDDLPAYDSSSGDTVVEVIEPGAAGSGLTEPPTDARVLLGSDGLAGWESPDGSEPDWTEADGYVEVSPGSGDIQTTTELGDSQIHLEWRVPEGVSGSGTDRGNSGLLMMGRYQLQLLDNDDNPVDPVQWAGAYPDQAPPLYDPAMAQGEWQTLDVVWQGPRFADDGSLSRPARATVLLNGTVVQARLVANGPNPDATVGEYQAHSAEAPLRLEENGDPVQFRNVWARSLEPSESESVEPISAPYGMDCGGAHTDETVTIDGLEFDPSPTESQAIDIDSNRPLSASEIWWPDAITATPNPNSDALGAGSEIANTDLDSLYQTEHWADGELTYDVTIENGTYDVTFHLAEIVITSSGSRVFSATVNGESVFEEYDIYDDVGANAAVTKTIEGVEVTDEELLVELESSIENPKVSGIEIRESSGGGGVPDEAIDPGTTIQFEAQSNSAWTGVAPSEIEGENPTLTLAAGETYTVEWTNRNGVQHNFVLEDADGNTVAQTDLVAAEGESETVEFEATDDLVAYYCQPHRVLDMAGEIEVV